jgi:hypothetical protein
VRAEDPYRVHASKSSPKRLERRSRRADERTNVAKTVVIRQLDDVDVGQRKVLRRRIAVKCPAKKDNAVEPVPNLGGKDEKRTVDRIGEDAFLARRRGCDSIDGVDIDSETQAQPLRQRREPGQRRAALALIRALRIRWTRAWRVREESRAA